MAEPAAAAELVEWVNDDGSVRAVVPRARMRAERLLHRSVFVVVRSVDEASVAVHRRADWKDVWPSYWDVAFGGVVAVGESWVDAARRELAEEAGVVAAPAGLRQLGEFRYRDEAVDELACVFETRSDGPFCFSDGEVASSGWVPVGGLEAWTAERPVCPDSLAGVVPLLRRRG
ncbi:MAG: NUDIX domain-containing protein [Acidimicrobiia bacterium]|nr:NUDIX domain-containing protein [Acidimicrobiia bacterium]